MKLSVKMLLWDFLAGGALVAIALFLAALLNPTAGGIFAGAPIRTAVAISLHYLRSQDLAASTRMAQGVLVAMVSNVIFALVLYLSLPKVGFWWGMVVATLVFVCSVSIIAWAWGAI